MRAPVKFDFAGSPRTVVPELGLTIDIEAETGAGIISLAERARALSCRTIDALAIIRLALQRSGVVYSAESMLKHAENMNPVEIQLTALKILNGFFVEATDAKKSRADKPRPTQTAVSP